MRGISLFFVYIILVLAPINLANEARICFSQHEKSANETRTYILGRCHVPVNFAAQPASRQVKAKHNQDQHCCGPVSNPAQVRN